MSDSAATFFDFPPSSDFVSISSPFLHICIFWVRALNLAEYPAEIMAVIVARHFCGTADGDTLSHQMEGLFNPQILQVVIASLRLQVFWHWQVYTVQSAKQIINVYHGRERDK